LSLSLIPVIDLKAGQVVAARGGQRHQYQPLVSPLCPDSNPHSALHSFNRLGFSQIYLADLDAITGQGHHFDALPPWLGEFPTTHFWLDGGFTHMASVAAAQETLCGQNAHFKERMHWVVGSETFQDVSAVLAQGWPPGFILSLDFGVEGFRGDPRWLNPDLWPPRVIVMTLPQVGAEAGPHWSQLESLVHQAGGRQLVAAGGVRHRQDLQRLKALGISAALVATALHRGQLP
jgi:phosphoribosylformimino-5-aminoimidazole carboxamide ribotide isomerase